MHRVGCQILLARAGRFAERVLWWQCLLSERWGGARDARTQCRTGRSGGQVERLSTCLALIEIVNSCNLACPTCFADSPRSTEVDAVPLAELQARIQGVIDRKGGIEILQLSGGEPTPAPGVSPSCLRGCHANPGHRLRAAEYERCPHRARRRFSLDQLGRNLRYGKFQLYLQSTDRRKPVSARSAVPICVRPRRRGD